MRPASRRRPIARVAATAALLAAAFVACGKKGPPLAPLRPTPAPVTDMVARRTESTVSLRFTIPSKDDGPTGTSPASLDRLEIYAYTDDPDLATKMPLAPRDVLKFAEKVATIGVKPPPPPEEQGAGTPAEPPAAEPAPPPDPRPAQGEVVVVTESLDVASFEPVDRETVLGIRLPAAPPEPPPVIARPLGPPLPIRPLVRGYLVVGYSRRGDRGNPSPLVSVPLGEPPQVPSAPTLTHTETVVQLTWMPPADAPVPVQVRTPPAAAPVPDQPAATPVDAPVAEQAAPPPTLASKSLAPETRPYRYNVYAVDGPDGAPAVVPLNPDPLVATSWDHPGLAYGQQRCYAVRAVRYYGDLRVEGGPSPTACVTPADTFPPAAPANLTAVATEGAISLIWDRSTATDVAGYLVLRGEAPGDTLVEVTAEPVGTTTYRDTTVSPGVRYVYAIVAVDRATPPNRSEPSNRVEESAR